MAAAAGALGSIDANTGDQLIGWDTDQFPTDLYLTTAFCCRSSAWAASRPAAQFRRQIRRESSSRWTCLRPHRGHGRLCPRAQDCRPIRKDGRLAQFIKERYSSWDKGIGAEIEGGKAGLKELEAYMLKKGEVAPNASGRQEFLENLINEFI